MSQRIAFLEKQLAARAAFAAESMAEVRARPHDRAAAFFARADAEHVEEIQRDIAIAKAERDRELFEVRLHGGPIGHGTIPIKLFAKFIEPFVSAVEHAAYRLHLGADARRGIPSSLSHAMDMQLAGVRSGSARLMLTGRLSPDLGGASVLENTLGQIFRLLEDEERFTDTVDAVGVKAARKMAEAFKPLEAAGSGMDMNWSAPNGMRHAWTSDARALADFRAKVEQLDEPEVFERIIHGTVRALRDNGVIELRDADGENHRVRYGLTQHDDVAELGLWMPVAFMVRTERTRDLMTGRDIDRNHLLRVITAK